MTFTDSQIEEILDRNLPWLHRRAKQFPGFPEDDLVQEALVAMWKELLKFDRDIPVDVHLRRRAYWKMLDIVSGRPWTTMEPYNKTKVTEVPTDHLPEVLTDLETFDLIIDRLDFSCLSDEIFSVLAETLTTKQYKYLTMKYVRQSTSAEIRQEFGYEPHTLITTAAKTALRSNLAHLRGMVK